MQGIGRSHHSSGVSAVYKAVCLLEGLQSFLKSCSNSLTINRRLQNLQVRKASHFGFSRGRQPFSAKGQTVCILDFVGQSMPVSTTQLLFWGATVATDNRTVNRDGCVPIKLYAQKQAVGRFHPQVTVCWHLCLIPRFEPELCYKWRNWGWGYSARGIKGGKEWGAWHVERGRTPVRFTCLLWEEVWV